MRQNDACDGEKEICLRVMLQILRVGAVALLLSALSPLQARAQVSEEPARGQEPAAAVDRGYFNQDLFVPKGQVIHNAICVFCSVQVEGEATGRVVVLFGNLSVTG